MPFNNKIIGNPPFPAAKYCCVILADTVLFAFKIFLDYLRLIPHSVGNILDISGIKGAYNSNRTIDVKSVIKSNNEYWLKIRLNTNFDNYGYIQWNKNNVVDTNNAIQNAIDTFGIYHINLPINFLYESGIGYKEQHIFKTNPEYQGFLMGLSDNYIALDSYRDNGYPMNGFILIGISFGESSAGLANDNYFGARFGFDEENSDDVRRLSIGQSQVIGAMRKCNLAFSAKDALNLMETEKFYVKAQGLVAFLQT